MKLFSVIALVFASATAFAYPTVNDTATFTGTVAAQGQSIPVSLKLTLAAFDAATAQYTMVQEVTAQGQVQSQQAQVAAADLLSKSQVQNILKNCLAAGGIPGNATAPAGTFAACEVTQGDANGTLVITVADVTFGFIKQVITDNADGSVTTLEMASHKDGQ